MWQHWINLILGLWLVVSAFIAFTPSGMVANLVIVGIAVAILALWEGIQHNMRTHARMDTRREQKHA